MAAEWVVGFHPVLAALETGRPVEVVWVQQGRHDARARKVIAAARRRGVTVRFVPRHRLDECAGPSSHNGCAARCAPVQVHQLEDMVAPEDRPSRLLLLDDVDDPHNAGAVVRSAAAFAVDGVILCGPGAPPLGGGLAKAAAGMLERVPIARCSVAGDAVVRLKEAGYWTLGADRSGRPVTEVDPTSRWVLCMGSEERGLRAKTRAHLDELIGIPIAAEVESLNVSVAAGILLFALSGRPPAP